MILTVTESHVLESLQYCHFLIGLLPQTLLLIYLDLHQATTYRSLKL